MDFNFSTAKTCQVAALLLSNAGGRMNYMELIKLMDIAEREAIQRRAWPVTGDALVSMEHGPVLSATLDLLKGKVHNEYWGEHIQLSGRYDVRLRQGPGRAELSDTEVKLLGSVYDRFGHMDRFKLRDHCHTFPEWRDPGKSSTPINLEEMGVAPEALRDGLDVARIHSLLGAVG